MSKSKSYFEDIQASDSETHTAINEYTSDLEVEIFESEMEDNQEALQKAQKKFDDILHATQESLDSKNTVDTKYLTEALANLSESVNSVVNNFDGLNKLSPSEQAMIDDHLEKIKTLKSELRDMRQDLSEEKGFFSKLFSGKGPTQEDVTLKNATIKDLESKTAQVEIQANKSMIDRLYGYNLEEALSEYNRRVDVAKTILAENKQQTLDRLHDGDTGIHAKTIIMEEIHKNSAQDIEALASKIGDITAKIQDKEIEIDNGEGITDVSVKQAELAKLREENEQFLRERKSALAAYNSSEKAIVDLSVDEQSALKAIAALEVDIEKLEIDSSKTETTMLNRLNMMKVMANIKVSKQLHDIESQVSESNTQFSAMAATVSDEALMDVFRNHPEQLKGAIEAKRAMIEKDNQIVTELDDMYANLEATSKSR